MADVKVTRGHRVAAMDAVHPDRPWWLGRKWIETGEAHYSRQAEGAALAIAQAEHHVRAAVIVELRGLVERAYKGDYVNRTLVVDADSLENLIDELEAANG